MLLAKKGWQVKGRSVWPGNTIIVWSPWVIIQPKQDRSPELGLELGSEAI